MPHVPLQTDVAALINMCTKPMQLAQYFCTGESIDNLEEQTQFDLKDINMKKRSTMFMPMMKTRKSLLYW